MARVRRCMYSHPPSDSAHSRVSVSIIFVGRILNQKVKGEKKSKAKQNKRDVSTGTSSSTSNTKMGLARHGR
jgi:hypothetical protein